MKYRIGETVPFDFVHIIRESMLLTLRSVAVQHIYLFWLCQSDVYHRKLRIGTGILQHYVHGKSTIVIVRFVKERKKALNKSRKIF